MRDTPDWPPNVRKPPLPPGYEWTCLRPALGLGEAGAHPWWIRATWTNSRGRKLHIKGIGLGFSDYHSAPEEAVHVALATIREHAAKRGANA